MEKNNKNIKNTFERFVKGIEEVRADLCDFDASVTFQPQYVSNPIHMHINEETYIAVARRTITADAITCIHHGGSINYCLRWFPLQKELSIFEWEPNFGSYLMEGYDLTLYKWHPEGVGSLDAHLGYFSLFCMSPSMNLYKPESLREVMTIKGVFKEDLEEVSKEFTISELEEKLGCKIKIIGGRYGNSDGRRNQ